MSGAMWIVYLRRLRCKWYQSDRKMPPLAVQVMSLTIWLKLLTPLDISRNIDGMTTSSMPQSMCPFWAKIGILERRLGQKEVVRGDRAYLCRPKS